MQANKIRVGGGYAVKLSGVLQRFNVTAVVTKRTSQHGNPHDYKDSYAEGYLISEKPPAEGMERSLVQMKLSSILGEYNEFLELVEQENKKRAEEKRRENERVAARDELVRLLYVKTGLPIPNDLDTYK